MKINIKQVKHRLNWYELKDSYQRIFSEELFKVLNNSSNGKVTSEQVNLFRKELYSLGFLFTVMCGTGTIKPLDTSEVTISLSWYDKDAMIELLNSAGCVKTSAEVLKLVERRVNDGYYYDQVVVILEERKDFRDKVLPKLKFHKGDALHISEYEIAV